MRRLGIRRHADGDGNGKVLARQKAQAAPELIGTFSLESLARQTQDYAAQAHAFGGQGDILHRDAAVQHAVTPGRIG